ncbi:MAG: zinc metallopeptidase [Clostridiales bacterium]|nr:zinc metallopeptidase [Clostridiales bacterium]
MQILLNYGYYYSERGLTGSYSLLLLAALGVMVLGLIASARVQSVFNKYSQMDSSCGMTASAIADRILRANGSSVRVASVSGSLTDNYNPKTGCVSLSQTVYSSSSIAAIAVAAHECGHVMQYEKGYRPIEIRNSILPVANIGARFSYLLVILGLFMGALGHTVSMIGVGLFGFALVFQLLTLPVELDASRRALDMLAAEGFITGGEEENAARKVLRAAAFTYVVAVLSSAISFLRLLAIANSNRRN